MIKTLRWPLLFTALGAGASALYGGSAAAVTALILIVLEISLSFDNAVVNAKVLQSMNEQWQRLFLTVGVLIAVFGMRLVIPFVIVWLTAGIGPGEALSLALDRGDPDVPGTYGYLLHEAHPMIAAFGGMFLLLVFLNFIFEEREIRWLRRIEEQLGKLGRLDSFAVVVSLCALLAVTKSLPQDKQLAVLVAGAVGILVYLLTSSLGEVFEEDLDNRDSGSVEGRPAAVAIRTGRAAFFTFLYLEVLDASFSMDGVVGAFAITSDPIIIAVGLGVGALYIRTLTVLIVRRGTLQELVYLEHGAHWAIGTLALILLITTRVDIPEAVTGFVGVAFIGAGLLSSVRERRGAAPLPG